MDAIWSMPLSKVLPGDKLQVLVENQGRIGYGVGNVDFKGNINLFNDIKKYPSIYYIEPEDLQTLNLLLF